MTHKAKLLKKIQNKNRVRFEEIEKLLLVYGFEIDKSASGAH